MANLSDFMADVLPYVTGCSYPLAEQHLRKILIDFCTHAPIVQVQLDPIDIAAGQSEYDIDLPTGTDVALVLDARYLGNRLSVLKTGDSEFSGHGRVSGVPTGLQQSAGNTFMLDAQPGADIAQAITLLVSTKPSRTASTVAEVLLNDYSYEIGQGAVGRLMLIPGQEFSSPVAAAAYTANYLRARTDARIRAERSFGSAGTRVQPRPFQ